MTQSHHPNNHARTLTQTNARAAATLKQLVSDRLRVLSRERVLSPDHSDTLITRSALAYWWGHDLDAVRND